MGISKIGNLFAANVDSVGAAKQAGQANQALAPQTQTQSVPGANSEAAVLSPSFGQSSSQASDSSRQDRVAQLKAQVSSGQYAPSSKDVAVAVVRDIG